MIQARCPICDRELHGESLQTMPSHPFCSDRCRAIDLARWLDQRYAVPACPIDADSEEEYDSEPAPP
jgi:endogenous inhibitor of DNA gyrase (YacG/DUF329 family)